MRAAHTVEQVRMAEAALMAQLPPGALMQRAARGLADACLALLGSGYGARVLLLVGGGDNGGDALFAGAQLAARGARVEAVLLAGDRSHSAGRAEYHRAGGRVVEAPGWQRIDLVVDAVVGIGGQPGLRPAAAELVRRATSDRIPVLAVDLPSGVDVDSGETPEEHVRADVTVTFGTHKVALLVNPAATAAGAVHVVDIGLGPLLPPAAVEALQAADVADLVKVPDHNAQKYSRGVVGVRAGSRAYTGAALLCVSGALSGCAGMVRYVGGAEDLVRAHHPEVVVGDGQVQAWVVGSGSGDSAAAALEQAIGSGTPMVVDADGLAHLPPRLDQPALLTPHAGELGRMLDVPRADIEARPLHFARTAARRFGAVVLLKGARALVATPAGRVRVNTTGVPWLATAGAGDVLSGLCGSLLATGLDPFDAGSVGAWLHGAAATVASGGGPITASDVAAAVPRVIAALQP